MNPTLPQAVATAKEMIAEFGPNDVRSAALQVMVDAAYVRLPGEKPVLLSHSECEISEWSFSYGDSHRSDVETITVSFLVPRGWYLQNTTRE